MPATVRPATDDDWPSIWSIITEVAVAEDTFPMDAVPDERETRGSWMTEPPGRVVVAVDADGAVLGTANMYANRPNQGAHVASGSLMVRGAARGRGVGRALVRDMVAWAAERGFAGVQFNAVAASNHAAVALYESEGFQRLGAVPGGFRHPTQGCVDLLILYRPLR